jgi:hypothetical protein
LAVNPAEIACRQESRVVITLAAKLNRDSFSNSIALPWPPDLSFPCHESLNHPRESSSREPPKTIEALLAM